MSNADIQFINLCKSILYHGTSTEGQDVRPHWEDGSSAYTLKKFGVVNKYDLRKEFPAITLRRTAIKSAVEEMLWIYQKKSNNIHDLNTHIWDSWADESGSIGKAYGYQVGHCELARDKKVHNVSDVLEHLENYSSEVCDLAMKTAREVPDTGVIKSEIVTCKFMDQMDAVLYDLKHTPFSRRIMISLWNVNELQDMNLEPCCWSCNFNVTDEGKDKLVLNMVLNQRSSDVLTANNWNVVQYAVLLMMVAQVSDMIPGELVHVMTDAHIYDKHIPIVKELIRKPGFTAPKVYLNPNITNFYDFRPEDVIVEDYKYHEFNTIIPVAI